MLIKTDVITDGVQEPIWYALGVADQMYSEFGAQLVVTSLVDGVHPDLKNIHGRGFAADLRISDLEGERPKEIRDELAQRLYSLGYDVVLEKDHIHIEWDPKPMRSEWLLRHA